MPKQQPRFRTRFWRFYTIKQWGSVYSSGGEMVEVQCELSWSEPASREPHTPDSILALTRSLHITSLRWDE
jgi:hypothetical protein